MFLSSFIPLSFLVLSILSSPFLEEPKKLPNRVREKQQNALWLSEFASPLFYLA
jgi:hypothetical protein